LTTFFYNKFYYELEKNIYKCSKLFTININMEKKLIYLNHFIFYLYNLKKCTKKDTAQKKKNLNLKPPL